MVSDQDIQELRERVDLPSLMRADGVRLTTAAGGFRASCPLHGGDNPTSFSVYRDAGHIWHWKCHSRDCGSGDAIEYLRRRHNMTFQEALEELASQVGMQLTPQPPAGILRSVNKGQRVAVPLKPATPLPPPPAEQQEASETLRQVLLKIPEAVDGGVRYAQGRGITDEVLALQGGAFELSPTRIHQIEDWLLRPQNAFALEMFQTAGILRPSKDGALKFNWWGRVVLFPSMNLDSSKALCFTGRRLDWTKDDRFGKYIHQSTAQGAILQPYGLPSLARAAATGKELIIVEGVFDCLGAQQLGFQAIAMLRRPGAQGWTDQHSSTVRVLEGLLPLLRQCRRVDIVPDQDGGASEDAGWRQAEGLSAWLRAQCIDSSALSLSDLGFPAFKDFGEAAEGPKAR